jgi:aminoglycoside phosphotransferase (APT) family kinase protein
VGGRGAARLIEVPGEKYRERLRALRPDVEHAFRSAPHVLLHGDFHYENVLRRGDTWKEAASRS